MGAHPGFRLLAVVFVLVSTIRAHAGCVDLAQLAHATVSIARYFDEAERSARPDLIGVRGTGWILSPTTIVTVAHVVEAMKLTDQDWKLVETTDENGDQLPERERDEDPILEELRHLGAAEETMENDGQVFEADIKSWFLYNQGRNWKHGFASWEDCLKYACTSRWFPSQKRADRRQKKKPQWKIK